MRGVKYGCRGSKNRVSVSHNAVNSSLLGRGIRRNGRRVRRWRGCEGRMG